MSASSLNWLSMSSQVDYAIRGDGVPPQPLPSWDHIRFLASSLSTPCRMTHRWEREWCLAQAAKAPCRYGYLFVSDMSFGALSMMRNFPARRCRKSRENQGIFSGTGGMLPGEPGGSTRYSMKYASGRSLQAELAEHVQAFPLQVRPSANRNRIICSRKQDYQTVSPNACA